MKDSLKIVLLADRIFKSSNSIDINSCDLEKISDEYFFSIYKSLNKIASKVTHYNTLQCFIDSIKLHKDEVVFTIYGGAVSRNRMGLVPGICEAYNIKFVGGDVYVRMISQDKQISKEIARRFNIKTAEYILIETQDQIKSLDLFITPPVVVKPNLEGSSIGIDTKSLCYSIKDMKAKAKETLTKFKQPILIEKYLEGKEVVVCIIGSDEEIHLFEVVEVYNTKDDNYFMNRLYTAEEKHMSTELKHRVITNQLKTDDRNKLIKLYQSLGKLDFMRFDGRIKNGDFYFIEQTPDAYIGHKSSFSDIYKIRGKSYEDLLLDIINISLDRYHIQDPNC